MGSSKMPFCRFPSLGTAFHAALLVLIFCPFLSLSRMAHPMGIPDSVHSFSSQRASEVFPVLSVGVESPRGLMISFPWVNTQAWDAGP